MLLKIEMVFNSFLSKCSVSRIWRDVIHSFTVRLLLISFFSVPVGHSEELAESYEMNSDLGAEDSLNSLLNPSDRKRQAIVDFKKLSVGAKATECRYVAPDDKGKSQDSAGANEDESEALIIARNLEVYRHQCTGNPALIVQNWKAGVLAVVDVRSNDEYQKLHVPGSINIAGHAIKTKPFLKSRPFVLIDDGVSSTSLMTTCTSLASKGYRKVTVFKGGLRGWSNFAELEGAVSANEQLHWITPRQHYSARNEYQWVIVNLGVDPATLNAVFGKSRAVSHQGGSNDLFDQLDKLTLTRAKQNSPDYRFLVVSESGGIPDDIEGRMLSKRLDSTYFLTGGIRDYSRFLNARAAMLARANTAPKQVKGCGI